MADDGDSLVLGQLGLPHPDKIQDGDLRKEWRLFLEQLQSPSSADIILSDPYFFEVETEGLFDSPEDWLKGLSSTAKARLLLLSILCRPLDPAKIWSGDEPRFVDEPDIAVLFPPPTFSLAEGTAGVPFGLDDVTERRKALDDPGLRQLLDAVPLRSAIETLTSEFIGAQPGNYAYQGWQVAAWIHDWAAVFAVTDAAHYEGYPFPWLLGFCRRNYLERNFISLLRDGASHFDFGFYLTYGEVHGSWPLAKMALSAFEEWEQPRWDLIDRLLELDDELLASVLAEGPSDPREFLSRVDIIIAGAVDAGFDDGVALKTLLERAGDAMTLEAVEAKLPDWQSDYDRRVEAEQAEREEKLSPFKQALESWPTAAVGPHPRSMNAGIGWNVRKGHVRSYIEHYIIAHGELPSGRHDLGITKRAGFEVRVGVIDFDEIARRVRSAAEG